MPSLLKRIFIIIIVMSLLGAAVWYLYQAQLEPIYYIAIFWIVSVLFLTWVGNYVIYLWLNRQLPWTESSLGRILVQLLLSGIYTLLCVNFTYYAFKTIFTDIPPDQQQFVLLNIYGVFVIIPVFSMYFGVYFLNKWKKATLEAEELKKENVRSELMALKNHIDPHFLFNNLNILSSLIETGNKPAQSFLANFSDVYRYVLKNKDSEIIPLKTEMEFLNAYLYLIATRYDQQITINKDVQVDLRKNYIPPLSLQMLIENAVKHNKFTKRNPLTIDIYSEKEHLVVRNNYSPIKKDVVDRPESGLKNIQKRYELISDATPEILKEQEYFIVKLPLLKLENS